MALRMQWRRGSASTLYARRPGRPAAEVLADASYGYRPHLLDRLPFDRTLFGVHLARKAKERDGVFLVSQT